MLACLKPTLYSHMAGLVCSQKRVVQGVPDVRRPAPRGPLLVGKDLALGKPCAGLLLSDRKGAGLRPICMPSATQTAGPDDLSLGDRSHREIHPRGLPLEASRTSADLLVAFSGPNGSVVQIEDAWSCGWCRATTHDRERACSSVGDRSPERERRARQGKRQQQRSCR